MQGGEWRSLRWTYGRLVVLIQYTSAKTWIEPGRFWCLPEVILPPSGMQRKRTVSGIGYGCQLPWVAELELATVNEWGWIIKHSKRPSLGKEEVGRSRLLTQRLNRSPVKHLNKDLLCPQVMAPHCQMSTRGSAQITYTWTKTKGKGFFFLWCRCVKHIMQKNSCTTTNQRFSVRVKITMAKFKILNESVWKSPQAAIPSSAGFSYALKGTGFRP